LSIASVFQDLQHLKKDKRVTAKKKRGRARLYVAVPG
jgi:hypothetical protein